MVKNLMKKLIKNNKYFIVPICLILILSFSRIIPHPYNFTPILSLGIFSGFYFKNFFLGSLIVISSMFIGDIYLGFHNTMFFTYISLLIAVSFGLLIKNFKFVSILLAGTGGSISFYIITNFGSWLTLPIYEKNFTGLIEAYILAIPFFHNTLLSTLMYLFILKIIFDLSLKKTLKLIT